MARPMIPAAVLADRGVAMSLPLLREEPVQVCYTFKSLLTLEERYGSVQAAVALVSAGAEGAAFTSLAGILAAGLLHEVDTDGRTLGTVDTLADYLDPQDLGTYAEVMGQAFSRSFPQAQAATGEPVDPTPPPVPSPGESGTGLPESTSDSPSPSSGA